MFTRNENKNDRIVRAILGVILLAAAWYAGGTLGIILAVVGLILLFTAATGFCLIYKLFGFSTCNK
jgi:hypothetical protein